MILVKIPISVNEWNDIDIVDRLVRIGHSARAGVDRDLSKTYAVRQILRSG